MEIYLLLNLSHVKIDPFRPAKALLAAVQSLGIKLSPFANCAGERLAWWTTQSPYRHGHTARLIQVRLMAGIRHFSHIRALVNIVANKEEEIRLISDLIFFL